MFYIKYGKYEIGQIVYLWQILKKPNHMNKLLFWLATAASLIATVLAIRISSIKSQYEKLEQNQQALLEDVEVYKTQNSEWAASTKILELELRELRSARKEDAKKIKELGIRLRHAESFSKSIAHHSSSTTLPLRDTVIVHDTVKVFQSQQPHDQLYGIIHNDSVTYRLEHTDTIYQVVHRVPRKFLFLRFGTKAIEQDVWTSNPNTKIVYTEYIELETRNKRLRKTKKR
jgi:hypothetical protein